MRVNREILEFVDGLRPVLTDDSYIEDFSASL